MDQKPENELRICLMNSNLVWGGGEKWHHEMACHFRDLGYSVLVITNRKSELYQRLDQKGILLESFRVYNLSFLNPVKIILIRNLLKKHKITCIFLGLSTDAKLGGLAAKTAGIKNIIYRRGTALPIRNSIINRFLFRSVLTYIITNSRDIKEKIFAQNNRIIDERKVHVIYNGVDTQLWPRHETPARQNERNKKLILGNAGRLVEQKGHEHLIRIAGLLKDKQVDFELHIAGKGKLENMLKKYCIEKNLENEIVFHGFVEKMQDFLSGLDMYISTSVHEGSSNVIIEAMATGTPVIAFDVSSMPELIEDNETGFLIPFPDAQLFAEKIIFLKNNRAELNTFGANARKRVEEKFDFSKNMQQIFKLIRERQ